MKVLTEKKFGSAFYKCLILILILKTRADKCCRLSLTCIETEILLYFAKENRFTDFLVDPVLSTELDITQMQANERELLHTFVFACVLFSLVRELKFEPMCLECRCAWAAGRECEETGANHFTLCPIIWWITHTAFISPHLVARLSPHTLEVLAHTLLTASRSLEDSQG